MTTQKCFKWDDNLSNDQLLYIIIIIIISLKYNRKTIFEEILVCAWINYAI